MKSKHEYIAAAYGEDWEKVSPFTDENGWVQRRVSSHGGTNGMEFENQGFERKSIDLVDFSGDGLYKWRPLSLNGVEKNNGWIRCDERMPEQEQLCLIVVKGEVQTHSKFGGEVASLMRHWPDQVKPTHWRPVEDFKPPLY